VSVDLAALDPDTCYRAMRARDRRFDGTFFVGVRTTGVYCRPICTARLPGRDRCVFFRRAAEAEREGFRACFRCRPELAPGLASVDSVPRLVRRAATAIGEGLPAAASLEALAQELGVTSRHLRRAMEAELGVSPVQYAQTARLAVAKRLLQDTAMPVAEIAFAAGFGSVRRLNALFKTTFGRPPSAIRRGGGAKNAKGDAFELRLDYRPPLAWPELLAFLRDRAIPRVEIVTDSTYTRAVRIGDARGVVSVRHADREAPALVATVSPSLVPSLPAVVARLRAMFDLDARPDVVAEHLRRDHVLRPLVDALPGQRLAGAFDPFEAAVRAILGQQVSVRGATTLTGRIAESFGTALPPSSGDFTVFPSAEEIAGLALGDLRNVGLTTARAETILGLARAVRERRIDLHAREAPEAVVAALVALPGIGPWTANYVAMRALGWPDAFIAGDLGVKKALGMARERDVEARAEAWRPWRAYAVMHLWRALGAKTEPATRPSTARRKR